jgi:hypothetical protein
MSISPPGNLRYEGSDTFKNQLDSPTGNSVLEVPVSNIHSFLLRDTTVSSA